MPQLHHRDPSIIGLLGASPHLSSPFTPAAADVIDTIATSMLAGTDTITTPAGPVTPTNINSRKTAARSEALDDGVTPPQTPMLAKQHNRGELHLEKGQVTDMTFERPFYEMIVDGIHSHPNSVRVSSLIMSVASLYSKNA